MFSQRRVEELAQDAGSFRKLRSLPAKAAQSAGAGMQQAARGNERGLGHLRLQHNELEARTVEIILVSRLRAGAWRRIRLSRWTALLLLVVGIGSIPGAAWLGYELARQRPAPEAEFFAAAWANEVHALRRQVAETRSAASESLDALAIRLGELQARVLRLDALGHRLVDMAGLDEEEFRFSIRPALGGPSPVGGGESRSIPDFLDELDSLGLRLEDRAPKLLVIESELMSARLRAEASPSGRPIKQGWLASPFGWRNDPITGRRAFHRGLDFSGPYRSDVVVVASGVVTRVESHFGNFGNMVEVDHGRGYATRYGHNDEILVAPGDKVSKGQTVALLGSSGRSTGPHVHFEVHLNGKAINPIDFVRP